MSLCRILTQVNVLKGLLSVTSEKSGGMPILQKCPFFSSEILILFLDLHVQKNGSIRYAFHVCKCLLVVLILPSLEGVLFY